MRVYRVLASLMAVPSIGSVAHAACTPSIPLVDAAPEIRSRPTAIAFVDTMKRDRFVDVAGDIVRWRQIAADAAGDRSLPAEIAIGSHIWLAWALDYLGKVDDAKAAIEAAQKLLVAKGRDPGLLDADLASILSMIQVDAGDIEQGATAAARAGAITDALAPESAEASLARNALANVAYARGQYADAEKAYRIASDLAQRCLQPDNGFIINEMASHAGVLYMVGRSDEALTENERAANWALEHLDESSPVVTLTLGNLGVMLRSAGRYPEAEAALRRVVDLEARYQADSWFYRAISLSNFASVLDLQGRHREAEALWLQSSQWHLKAPIKRDPATRAYPLRFSADSAERRGDLALALARRREAIALMTPDAPADHPELARARIELGLTLVLLGRPQEGLSVARPAIGVVQRKLDPSDVKRLTAELDYGRIVAAAAGPETGYALIAPIAARLEAKMLDSATSRGDLIRYGPAFSASFAAVTELALVTGRHEQAFHALQLASLSDIVVVNSEVAARSAAVSAGASGALRALQDRIKDRQSLDRARTFATASGDARQLWQIQAEIRANDARITEASQMLDRVFPAYRRLSRPEPITLAAFSSRLEANQILLAPLLVEGSTLAIMVTSQGLVWSRTPYGRGTMDDLVLRVRRAIDAARTDPSEAVFDVAAARALHQALIPDPLAELVASHRDILSFGSGPLSALPVSLLVEPGTAPRNTPLARLPWLVRRHSVTVLASLSGSPEAPKTKGTRLSFLGLGAPDEAGPIAPKAVAAFRGGDIDPAELGRLAPLPRAASELRGIASALRGPATLLIGPDATKASVQALDLRGFDVVAIATHALGGGLFAGLNEPALVLALGADGKGGADRLLTASEIASLRLDSDWVILSACDTAGGLGSGAPAYSGLATAFMHAGARALLVSHWPVRDDAAAALTVATVQATGEGVSRPRALQQAMLHVMQDRTLAGAGHPAAWAPFVLIER
jgi:CHAT domain-containing protein/tetratricopeptide (TPR) repeat protein